MSKATMIFDPSINKLEEQVFVTLEEIFRAICNPSHWTAVTDTKGRRFYQIALEGDREKCLGKFTWEDLAETDREKLKKRLVKARRAWINSAPALQ
jgi:hypothetical protein